MRLDCKLGLCLLTSLVWTPLNWAGPKEDPAAILDKAIAAHGGREKLAKYPAASWKAKGTLEALGMKMPYLAEYAHACPDKLRFHLTMDFGGKKTEIIAASDGTKAWEQSGELVREMDKDKGAEFQHMAYTMFVSSLLPLKEKDYTLTGLGESKVGEKDVAGIKVARKGKRDVSLFFDKKTGLLAKTQTRVMDEFTMKEVTQDVLFTGYRDQDGMKVFDRLTIYRDGTLFIEEALSDQRSLTKVDEKLFAQPAAKK